MSLIESRLLTNFALAMQDLFGIKLPKAIPETKIFREPVQVYTKCQGKQSRLSLLIDLSQTGEGPLSTEPLDPEKMLEEYKRAVEDTKRLPFIKNRRH